jgi:hypothetical protein
VKKEREEPKKEGSAQTWKSVVTNVGSNPMRRKNKEGPERGTRRKGEETKGIKRTRARK